MNSKREIAKRVLCLREEEKVAIEELVFNDKGYKGALPAIQETWSPGWQGDPISPEGYVKSVFRSAVEKLGLKGHTVTDLRGAPSSIAELIFANEQLERDEIHIEVYLDLIGITAVEVFKGRYARDISNIGKL